MLGAWVRWMIVVAVLLTSAVTFFQVVYRPWQLNWGATEEEIQRPMPGDSLVAEPTFNATRAVTIEGSAEEVWPWIIQIGFRRAGFYSHDWLDNDGVPSATTLLEEYQALKLGDVIPLTKEAGATVVHIEPARSLVLEVQNHDTQAWMWAWGLYPAEEGSTRLITRLRVVAPDFRTQLMLDAFEIVMMREHLLGIQQRVEAR